MSRSTRWGLAALVAGLVMVASTLSQAPASYVLTSEARFAPRWESIPAPEQPLAMIGRYNGFSNGIRNTGLLDVAYCLVDEQGRLSAMSPAVRVAPRVRDGEVIVNTPGLDPWTRACGTMWWGRYDGQVNWFALGAGMNAQLPWQVYKPYLPLAGWEHHASGGHVLFQAAYWPASDDPSWQLATSNLAAPPAPLVRLREFPNCAVEVAYSWKCNDGESPLSGVLSVPAFHHPSDPLYASTRSDFHAPVEVSRNCIPPQGACGMYVYLRQPSKPWHRQPSPSGADVWPIDFNRLPLSQFVRTGIQPTPGRSRSWLSSLQIALKETARDVVVVGDQDVASPVISSYERPVVGHQFNRRVGSFSGGPWELRDVGTVPATGGEPAFTGYFRAFPLWVENSQKTRLVGCQMKLDEATCGIAFFDHSGGGAFHFRGVECGVHVVGGLPRDTYGVRCLWESRGPAWSDHSASEPVFRDLDVLARFPVVVEGNQSANWLFDTSTLVGTGGADSAILTQTNVGQVTFLARLTCDNARCVVAAVAASRTNIANIFLDQGMPAWVCAGHYGSNLRLSIAGNKVNQWTPWLHPVELATGGLMDSKLRLKLSDLDSQSNGPVDAVISAPRPGTVDVWQVDPVAILSTVNLPRGAAEDMDATRAAARPPLKPRPRGWVEPDRQGLFDSARFRPAKRRVALNAAGGWDNIRVSH